MDAKQLRCFLAVAELENFTMAGERINLAQSALSRQIKNLEQDLGVPLFDRSGRKVRLTTEGNLLRGRARAIVDQLAHLRDDVTQESGGPSGIVAVGALSSFANLLFPPLAEKFRRQYPRVRLNLVEALTTDLQSLLLQDQIDIAVVTLPEPDRNLTMEYLCSEQLFVASATKQAPFGATCLPSQISGLPLILTSLATRERLWIERFAVLHGISLNVVVEGNSLLIARDLAQRGIGHLLVPFSAISNVVNKRKWRFSRVKGASIERMLARRADRPVGRVAEHMIESIHAEVAAMKKARLVN